MKHTNYAEIDANGIVFSILQSQPGLQSATLIEVPALDSGLIGMRYLPATSEFEPVLVPPNEIERRISPLAFRRRFTPAERAAIEWAAVDRADDPPALRQQAAALRSSLKDQEMATFIDLDDPDVISGTRDIETVGLIAAGRSAEILNAPIQSKELP